MNNLYGSAGSKDAIVSVIESFWYRKDVTLEKIEEAKKESYNVHLGGKLVEGWIVVKAGKRYRFELVNNS